MTYNKYVDIARRRQNDIRFCHCKINQLKRLRLVSVSCLNSIALVTHLLYKILDATCRSQMIQLAG